jgi:S-DNA-T family DNA segregation ATPase FtsK/SpoIIIE
MAVAIVAESRNASISYLQRRLKVGYNRAARMIEQMEREGVVGPQIGVRPREVYVQPVGADVDVE